MAAPVSYDYYNREPANLIYGLAFYPKDRTEATELFETLRNHNVRMLDTARTYVGAEELIRELELHKMFQITTKTAGFRDGLGGREEVLKSAKESFETLGVDKVDIFMLHSPDPVTPIGETIDAIQELYLQGRFNKFGLSNFSTSEVISCYTYACSKGYVRPTVYQANYNLLARKNEEHLFPTLRSLNISIQAYSPTAGGFLVKPMEEIFQSALDAQGQEEYVGGRPKGYYNRWDPLSLAGKIYQHTYNKSSLISFRHAFSFLAKESGSSELGLAYRWVRYHSELRGEKGDVIIIGARSLGQLREVLEEVERGPLEHWVVERLNVMYGNIPERDLVSDVWEALRDYEKAKASK